MLIQDEDEIAIDYDPEMASPSAKYKAKEAFVLQARAMQHQQQMKQQQQQQQQQQPADDAYARALAGHAEPGAGWRVSMAWGFLGGTPCTYLLKEAGGKPASSSASESSCNICLIYNVI
jgi:hypothetical protein